MAIPKKKTSLGLISLMYSASKVSRNSVLLMVLCRKRMPVNVAFLFAHRSKWLLTGSFFLVRCSANQVRACRQVWPTSQAPQLGHVV